MSDSGSRVFNRRGRSINQGEPLSRPSPQAVDHDGEEAQPDSSTKTYGSISHLPINVRSWALVGLTTSGLRQPRAPAASHSAGLQFLGDRLAHDRAYRRALARV